MSKRGFRCCTSCTTSPSPWVGRRPLRGVCAALFLASFCAQPAVCTGAPNRALPRRIETEISARGRSSVPWLAAFRRLLHILVPLAVLCTAPGSVRALYGSCLGSSASVAPLLASASRVPLPPWLLSVWLLPLQVCWGALVPCLAGCSCWGTWSSEFVGPALRCSSIPRFESVAACLATKLPSLRRNTIPYQCH